MVRTRVMGRNCSRRHSRRRLARPAAANMPQCLTISRANRFDTAGRRRIYCTLRRRIPPNHLVDSGSYRARFFSRCSQK
jgi:hypothetical protein